MKQSKHAFNAYYFIFSSTQTNLLIFTVGYLNIWINAQFKKKNLFILNTITVEIFSFKYSGFK